MLPGYPLCRQAREIATNTVQCLHLAWLTGLRLDGLVAWWPVLACLCACSNDRVALDKHLEQALRKMGKSGEVQVRQPVLNI